VKFQRLPRGTKTWSAHPSESLSWTLILEQRTVSGSICGDLSMRVRYSVCRCHVRLALVLSTWQVCRMTRVRVNLDRAFRISDYGITSLLLFVFSWKVNFSWREKSTPILKSGRGRNRAEAETSSPGTKMAGRALLGSCYLEPIKVVFRRRAIYRYELCAMEDLSVKGGGIHIKI
jgi:hypothetical protein